MGVKQPRRWFCSSKITSEKGDSRVLCWATRGMADAFTEARKRQLARLGYAAG